MLQIEPPLQIKSKAKTKWLELGPISVPEMLKKVEGFHKTNESLQSFNKDEVFFIGLKKGDKERNGPGRTIVVKEEYIFEGIYINDQKRYGREIHKDGTWYEGFFENRKWHGQGKLYKSRESQGEVQEGIFEKGEFKTPN